MSAFSTSLIPSSVIDPQLRPVFSRGIRKAARDYKRSMVRMVKDPDVIAVHDFRVASRRLVIAIDLLTAEESASALLDVRTLLRRGLKTTGVLRDTQVMIDLLRERLADAPTCREFYDQLVHAEVKLRNRLSSQLRAGKFVDAKSLRIVDVQLRETATLSHVLPAVEVLYAEFRKQIDHAGKTTVAMIHRSRETIREIRDAFDLLSLTTDESAEKHVKLLREIHKQFGEVHDLDNLRLALLTTSSLNKSITPARRQLAKTIGIEIRAHVERCKAVSDTVWDFQLFATAAGMFGPAHARIYLLRHAIAEKANKLRRDDRTRALTKRGRRKMKRVAEGIASLKLSPEIILTSPFVRAYDTARILAGELPNNIPVRRCPWLTPLVSTETAVAALAPFIREGKSVIVVGHEPSLQQLAGKLTGKSTGLSPLRKGGLCNITFATGDVRRKGTLTWTLTPKQLAS